ncbi:MAG: hypothetical protein ACK5OQ_11300 [Burkholderiales bacterium]
MVAGFARVAGGGAAFVIALGVAFEVALGGADFVAELFDVTFGGAFESLEDDGLAAVLLAAFGTTFVFVPFAVAFLPLTASFGTGFALGAVFLTDFAFTAVLDWAAVDFVDGLAFATALTFTAGFAGAFFLATLIAFVTFVDFPLTLLLVAVLAFFAVANLISSAVFLLFSLPPVAGGGISKTRKSTETIGQKQRIIRQLQLLENKRFSAKANMFAAVCLKFPERRANSDNRTQTPRQKDSGQQRRKRTAAR